MLWDIYGFKFFYVEVEIPKFKILPPPLLGSNRLDVGLRLILEVGGGRFQKEGTWGVAPVGGPLDSIMSRFVLVSS